MKRKAFHLAEALRRRLDPQKPETIELPGRLPPEEDMFIFGDPGTGELAPPRVQPL